MFRHLFARLDGGVIPAVWFTGVHGVVNIAAESAIIDAFLLGYDSDFAAMDPHLTDAPFHLNGIVAPGAILCFFVA